MTDGVRAGTAYVDFKGDFSGLKKEIGAQLAPITARFSKFGAGAAGAVAGVTAAAAIASKALYDIGDSFDQAYDTIRVNTGKTGKSLDRLKNDFRAVVKTTPTDFATAADAIADLNSRLGESGKPLRVLTRNMLELSRMTGTDVQSNIQTVTRLYADWGVQQKQQIPTLNKLWRAHEKTGVGISDLADNMVKFGSPLRQLGFNFDEAAAMFSTFEQQGVNMQTLLPGLRFALMNLSNPTKDLSSEFKTWGVNMKDPKKALDDVFALLKNAPTDLKANKIAFEVFGRRAGPEMAAAVREGRFSYKQLLDEIAGGRDTVMKASKDTRDFSENWQILKNRVFVVLEPIAKRVFGVINDGMSALVDFDLGNTIRQLGVTRQDMKALGGVFQGVGKVIETVGKLFTDYLVDSINGFLTVFRGSVKVIRGIVNLIGDILHLRFKDAWEDVKDIFRGALDVLVGIVKIAAAPFRGAVKLIAKGLKSAFGDVWADIKSVFVDGANAVIGVVNKIIDVINVVPGVPDIGHVGTIGAGGNDAPAGDHGGNNGLGRVAAYATGGHVTRPMYMVGEEAPRHNEWVIATNPAYRRDNLGYWAKAGHDLGVPGFAKGGNGISASGHGSFGSSGLSINVDPSIPNPKDIINKGAQFFIDKLPKPHLPKWLGGLGSYLIDKVSAYITGGFDSKEFGKFTNKGQTAIKGLAGQILKGRVTWFNGGPTAGGSNTSLPGLALNLHPGTDSGWNNPTTDDWMRRSLAGHPVFARVSVGGKSANLPITDKGPAGWTGNAIDVTQGGVGKLGFSTSNFPSGTVGTAEILKYAMGGLVGERNAPSRNDPYRYFPAFRKWAERHHVDHSTSTTGPALAIWRDVLGGYAHFRHANVEKMQRLHWPEDDPMHWWSRYAAAGPNSKIASSKAGNAFNALAMKGFSTFAPKQKAGGFLPRTIERIRAKAELIARNFTGYVWGGGHGEGTNVTSNGLDCSGAIAKLVQQSGWKDFAVAVSTDYARRFHPGEGDDFTLWSNPEHTFADIRLEDGTVRQWGTNTSNGLGYHTHTHAGFTPSHPILGDGSGAGGGGGPGLTDAQKKKREGKARKANRLAKLKVLEALVGKAETPMGRRGALWDVISYFGRFGLFDKDSRKHTLDAVRRAGSFANPLGGLKVLSGLMRFLDGHVDISGQENLDHPLEDAMKKARETGQALGSKRRRKVLSRVALQGLDPRQRKIIEALDGRIEKLGEEIDITDRQAQWPGSPGGTDYSDSEVMDLVGTAENPGKYRKLLGLYKRQRDVVVATRENLAGHLEALQPLITAATPKDSRTHWRLNALKANRTKTSGLITALGGRLVDLQGVTGQGGAIFDTQDTIKTFVGESSASALDIDGLRGLLEAARYGVFDAQLPKYHTGGVVPGPATQERPIMARGGEGIFTEDQMAALGGGTFVGYADIYIGAEKIDERVELQFRQRDREAALAGRAGR